MTEASGRISVSPVDLRRVLQQGFARGESVLIQNRHQAGDYVWWDEIVRYGSSGVVLPARAIIRNGRIRSLAYGDATLVDAGYATAPASDELPAAIGSTGVALMMFGALVLACGTSRRRRFAGRFTDVMLRDLSEWHRQRQTERTPGSQVPARTHQFT